MPTVPQIHRRGPRAAQPEPPAVTIGTLYFVTDEGITERSNGTAWEAYSGAGIGTAHVTGPASAGNLNIAVFDGTTGATIKDGGTTISALVALVSDLQTQIDALQVRVAALEAAP